MKTEFNFRSIAFLGDYLPRKCGIATFTSDLLGAVAARHPTSRCFAVPVNDINGFYEYPDVVRFEIEEQDLVSYRRAADFLNNSNVGVVSVQHEFGIYGGPAGSYLLGLLHELRAPAVTTLHTVLLKPNADQHRVMRKLIEYSARLVVMTERGRSILLEVYQAPLAKIDLIPHGIPDVTFVAPGHYKDQFGMGGKKVLLTFGLLSPNKGIEHVLNALPQVVAEFPDVVYIVLGATHPHELRTRGEAYRLGLKAIAKRNKIENNVIFDNRFVDLKELTEFIGAADLYITPYLYEAQITSGTLAYAFGAGKAVISTPYWHAAELLKNQRGVLVPFADPGAIAREAIGLLRDEPRRNTMSMNAYKLGREMVWSKTAGLYMRSFESARKETAAPRVAAPANGHGPVLTTRLNLDHLYHATASRGILKPTVLLSQLVDQLSARVLPAAKGVISPQAWACSLIRIHEYLGSSYGDPLSADAREDLTGRLTTIFDNETLRWLVQYSQLRPISGNGFHKWNGARADFDQPVIETPDSLPACLEAHRPIADPWCNEQAQQALDWVLGRNDRASPMLAFLLSLAEMRMVQDTATGVRRAALAASITK